MLFKSLFLVVKTLDCDRNEEPGVSETFRDVFSADTILSSLIVLESVDSVIFIREVFQVIPLACFEVLEALIVPKFIPEDFVSIILGFILELKLILLSHLEFDSLFLLIVFVAKNLVLVKTSLLHVIIVIFHVFVIKIILLNVHPLLFCLFLLVVELETLQG